MKELILILGLGVMVPQFLFSTAAQAEKSTMEAQREQQKASHSQLPPAKIPPLP